MISDADLRREEKAYAVNQTLLDTYINVMGGGRSGPYRVSIRRLNEKEMREVVSLLRKYDDARRGQG